MGCGSPRCHTFVISAIEQEDSRTYMRFFWDSGPLKKYGRDCALISYLDDCEYVGEANETKPAGLKHDKEKPRWDLLPMGPVEAVVRVLTHGARKYGDCNWVQVDNARNRYYAAAMRHLAAWRTGELRDPETGESHLAHAACCLLFLLWHDDQGEKK